MVILKLDIKVCPIVANNPNQNFKKNFAACNKVTEFLQNTIQAFISSYRSVILSSKTTKVQRVNMQTTTSNSSYLGTR